MANPSNDDNFLKIDAASLHPTQFVIGFREVEERKAILKNLERGNKDDLKAYLKKKAGRVVKGPDGNWYLVDGHHLAKAMVDLQVDAKMRATMLADWTNLRPEFSQDKRMASFWKLMTEAGYVYLIDETGRKRPAAELGKLKKIADLRDDPYRSLAWFVRERGGYINLNVPFQEFLWANFFRANLPFDDTSNADFERAVTEGVRLAKSPAANTLPGFQA